MEKNESARKNDSMGYKDKQKALYTLKCLDGRDIIYQKRAINHYYTSAKKILKITKDEEKRKNIGEAIEVFDEWLRDYADNDRGKTNLPYLPIETLEAFRPLAETYSISEAEFYKAYKETNGDYKSLRTVKLSEEEGEDITWDIERNKRLTEIIKSVESSNLKWYEAKDNKGVEYPSREHTRCILLAYSPEPSKLKALIPKLAERARDDDKMADNDEMADNEKMVGNEKMTGNDKMVIDEEPPRGTKRPRETEKTSSDSSSENEEPTRKTPKKTPNTENRKEESSALGFKDKEKALRSIESLEGRDISYQYHAITGLIKRAGRVITCTKDVQKIDNIKAAIEVLENWVTDYSVNHRSRENFGYLGLDLVQAHKPLAEKYDLQIPDFVGAYEEVGGDYKKLRSVKVPGSDITWDIERNKKLRELVGDIKDRHVQWFGTDEPLRGLPTKEHTECILWGFSHEPAKLKKILKLLNELC